MSAQRVGIYTRVSSQRQAEKWSLQAQRKILTEFAEKRGWIPSLYNEGGVSAETIAARPVLQRLLSDVADGAIDVILVIEIERLCRASDLTDYARITSIVRRAGALIATPEREFDLSRAEDDFESDLRGILSKREKRKILERTLRGKREARDSGKYIGGTPPTGYRYDRAAGSLVVEPAMIEVIRFIYDSPLSHTRAAREVRDRFGVLLWADTVRHIRRNPAYAGKQTTSTGHLVDAEWEAIIPWDTWKAVSTKWRVRPHLRTWNGERVHLLVGLALCANCGGRVHALKCGPRAVPGAREAPRHSYRCRRALRLSKTCSTPQAIRGWIVEDCVLDALERHCRTQKRLREVYRATQARLEAERDHQDLRAVEAGLRAAERRRERLLDAVEGGALTLDQISERARALDIEIAALRNRLQQLQEAAQAQLLPPLEAFLSLARDRVPESLEGRRALIGAFIQKLTVNFETRDIHIGWTLDDEPARYRIPMNLKQLVMSYGSVWKARDHGAASKCRV